ncbi:MAG: hypothetical protein H3C36_13845 [Chitinophagaceae bacterium]|nr:hypothetical protein [Chitinophagaceae bacterium]
MLWVGKHITTPGDPLQPASVEKVFRAIINPDSEVATLQRRLQAIRMVDIKQYRKLKTGLPYLVCAHFHPKTRKKENFIFTDRFIIDMDHLSEFGQDVITLKNKLRSDPRIELMFASPGGDGLKAVFGLKEKISDSGFYALFYKTFCLRFAKEYDLEGVVDSKTNDVSRCCFVSHDPDAYYNPNADRVDTGSYMPEEGALELDLLKAEIKQQEQENDRLRKETGVSLSVADPLPDDIINAIKLKVGVRLRKPVEKQYEQPEELNDLMNVVNDQVSEVGAQVLSTTPISYGRKIKIGAGKYWAEVNLFYGHRGVSIVGTSKTGSNKELCNSMVALLKSHFNNTG